MRSKIFKEQTINKLLTLISFCDIFSFNIFNLSIVSIFLRKQIYKLLLNNNNNNII